MSLVDRLLRRTCGHCGGRPKPRIAERLVGRSGDVEVELTNFPYKACECGRLAKWAFDPGLDFSTQLFREGIPFASPGGRCAGCGAILSSRRLVELEAEARLEGFEPIGFRTRLEGFECERCGLQQAPEHSFTSTESDGASSGADALNDAVAKVGLR